MASLTKGSAVIYGKSQLGVVGKWLDMVSLNIFLISTPNTLIVITPKHRSSPKGIFRRSSKSCIFARGTQMLRLFDTFIPAVSLF